VEEQVGKLSDRVAWLEARLLEEREANDELSKHLVELRKAATKAPEPPPPTADELLAALQHVLDATSTASTRAAAALVDAVIVESSTCWNEARSYPADGDAGWGDIATVSRS
jgi:hypothetical protein